MKRKIALGCVSSFILTSVTMVWAKPSLVETSSVAQTAGAPVAPKTPPGMARCERPFTPVGDLPRNVGEIMQYDMKVLGINIGQVALRIERDGQYGGQDVTEYRGSARMASLINMFFNLEGRAASIVPNNATSPAASMNRYTLRGDSFQETQRYSKPGIHVVSERSTSKTKIKERRFHAPVWDFISGVYALRRLPQTGRACAVVYGNHRAYTAWLDYQRTETIDTDFGKRSADVYRMRYGSDRGKKIQTLNVWVDRGAQRVILRMEAEDAFGLSASLSDYQPGSSS